jgi:hypothetical protein
MINKKGLGKFNISRRFVYTLIAVFLFLFIGIGVYAMTTGNAPNPGHVLDTVSAPSGCGSNTLLKWTGSAWACISADIPICTGAEQGITWTGNAWGCVNLN